MNNTILIVVAAIAITVGVVVVTDPDNTVGDVVSYNEAATSLSIQYGTMKAIENVSGLTSEGVIAFVDDASELFTDETTVTLDTAIESVHGLIPWQQFSQNEKLIISGLFEIVETEIRRRIELGDVNADAVVTVNTLLGYVKQGARLAGTPVSPN